MMIRCRVIHNVEVRWRCAVKDSCRSFENLCKDLRFSYQDSCKRPSNGISTQPELSRLFIRTREPRRPTDPVPLNDKQPYRVSTVKQCQVVDDATETEDPGDHISVKRAADQVVRGYLDISISESPNHEDHGNRVTCGYRHWSFETLNSDRSGMGNGDGRQRYVEWERSETESGL